MLKMSGKKQFTRHFCSIFDKLAVPLQPESRNMVSTDDKTRAAELYVQGNALRKQQRWGEAMNAYEQAAALDPESPAAHARQMLLQILEFYNKDSYNP